MEEIILKQLGIVSCDFEKIKNHLDEQLQLYRGMVFTEEKKKEAKETVAQLRKEKKSFEDSIKAVKKEYMKPFDEFMIQANEISGMFDQPIAFINEQVDAFEAQRIEAKRSEVKAIYEELVPELEWQEVIAFDKIFNPKWLNATFTAKQIKDEIMERKTSAKQAVETIKALNSEKTDVAIDMYKKTFDLTSCIAYITTFENQKREIMAREQERIQREAEERIRAEERAKIKAEEEKAQAVEEARCEAVEALIPDANDTEVKRYTYTIEMSRSAKEKLEMYMNSIGLEFAELPM